MAKNPRGVVPVKLGEFVGLNNVLQPEQTRTGELQIVNNVYVNDALRLRRRKGYHKVYSGIPHSMFSDGNMVVFREGTWLKRLHQDFSATTLRSDLTGSRIMRHLALNSRIYYTDEVYTGVVDDGVSRSWGLTLPPTPVLAEDVGELVPGRYQVVVTYMRDDGQESGSSFPAHIEVTAGGMQIGNIVPSTDPTVTWILVYVTTSGGEKYLRQMRIPNGADIVTAPYRSASHGQYIELRTLNRIPPPPGQLLAYCNGRIYIAQDNIVWYTDPQAYELVDLENNFIPFSSRVTFLAGLPSGLWVGTREKISFWAGNPPDPEARYSIKADFGSIEGTQYPVTDLRTPAISLPGESWLVTTQEGICVAGADGVFKNLTEGRVHFPNAVVGVGGLRNEEDAEQYIVGLFYSNDGDLTLPVPIVAGEGEPGLKLAPPPPAATKASTTSPIITIT